MVAKSAAMEPSGNGPVVRYENYENFNCLLIRTYFALRSLLVCIRVFAATWYVTNRA